MGSLKDKTIYAIQHNLTKRIYIGCSLHFEKRIREHFTHLRNGNHNNSELQKDYDLYGNDYSFYVIEKNVSFYKSFEREREWQSILKSNCIETGYNLAKRESSYKISDFEKIEVKIGSSKKKGIEKNGLRTSNKQQSFYWEKESNQECKKKEEGKEEKNPPKQIQAIIEKRKQSFLKLETLVNARNTTFYVVAKDLGFAPTVFSDWKSGKSMPKTDKLIKISEYFGVTVDYFIN